MSRCFPYPPPHFDESLIKSIKIHKKEKKDREARTKAKGEKEKRREKKENKDKANQIQVNSKHEENSCKKRKYENKNSLSEKELFCQKNINDVIEQLEASVLTLEHEMPCPVKYKHDSPESSQDSNKRRKVVPSNNNVHGSVLRIKLPASKQGADSGLQLLPTSRQGRDSGPQLLPTSRQERDSGPTQLLPTSRKEIDSGSRLLPTSRREGDSGSQLLPTAGSQLLGRDSGSQLLQKSRPGRDSGSQLLQKSRPGRDSGSQLLQKSQLGGDSASLLVPTSGKGGDSCSQVLLAIQPKPGLGLGLPLLSSKRKNPEPPAAKSRQLVHDQPAGDEQPCFSGRSKEEITVSLPTKKTCSSKRVGGRRWQKEQFKDLIENWNSSLQSESVDTADDWLLVTPEQKSTNNSSVVSVVGSDCGNHKVLSQQPRACYIPELDVYQLPYVVPF